MKIKIYKAIKLSHSLFFIASLLYSCSVSKQINKQAKQFLFTDSAISQGHIGISVFDPSTGKYLYNHNADKYFIPASNTKLFSWYAGMKYLGDSLVGIEYQKISDTAFNIFATGDPSFLHSDFKRQPVLDFLKETNKSYLLSENGKNNFRVLGNGWAWNDYNEYYMAERNAFPIYGNIINVKVDNVVFGEYYGSSYAQINWNLAPKYFTKNIDSFHVLRSKLLSNHRKTDSLKIIEKLKQFEVSRDINSNKLSVQKSNSIFSPQEIPLFTDKLKTAISILQTDHNFNISEGRISDNGLYPEIPPHFKIYKIYSQPSDSLFKPMMHRSDNFFAEQTLLMASNEYIGYMSDRDMIDTILKTSLKNIPQKPRWVDGSGLSRYNLFTPQSFVWLLHKTKDEFDWERIKNILPTGGEGTLSSYYKEDAGFIYAKTGTLSNNCALSGYLITKKNKLLIFSVLVNNYPTGATPVRRAVEKFIKGLREKY